jgi:hypothetical protein
MIDKMFDKRSPHMKARITVTVDEELLRRAESRAGKRSRSYAVESALRLADRLAAAKDTVAYYRSRTEEERAEDQAWGDLAALAAAAVASEDPPPAGEA